MVLTRQYTKEHRRMFRSLSRIGSEPGDMYLSPELNIQDTKIKIAAFNEHELVNEEIKSTSEILPYLQKYPMAWVRIYGLGTMSIIQEIAKIFSINNLTLEDVLRTHQRPKIEDYGNMMFGIARLPCIVDNELDLEQVSVIWGENFVISFNEKDSNTLDPLLDQIRKNILRNNLLGSSYLAYAIIDTTVDSFFPILETYGLTLDDIEEDAILNPSRRIIINIHNFKRDLAAIRRAMWSQREAVRNLGEIVGMREPDMKFFIRDCEDHTIQLIDILESYRERTNGLMDIYLSAVNNKMNEVMKVLTMIATIFMPIGVVASIYGMNFDRSSPYNLPELSWKYGYIYALCVMLTIASIMIVLFWRRGWLRRRDLG